MKSDILKKIVSNKIKHDGFAFIAIEGDCMSPLLCDKEIVIISDNRQYKVGDIVLVYVSKSLRAHRIVKIENGVFYTKGDHSLFIDSIDEHIPEIIGSIVENTTKHLTYCRVPIISRLISYISIFESNVRKQYGEKTYITHLDKLITYFTHLELQYYKHRKMINQ